MEKPIEKLPPELLAYLLSFLDGRDVSRVCQACRQLQEASKIELIWQRRCEQEFGVFTSAKELQPYSFYELYTKLLYKYGVMLGIWQPNIGAYGGLLEVKYADHMLVGVDYSSCAGDDVTKPLLHRTLFTIESLHNAPPGDVMCHKGFLGPHPCSIKIEKCGGSVKFSTVCDQKAGSIAHNHPNGKQAEYAAWVMDQSQVPIDNIDMFSQDLLMMKFFTYKQYMKSLTYNRLSLPPTNQNGVRIQPGFFKGNYGGHGIEIVCLTYDNAKNEAKAVKVSGDPNVPAGQVSLCIDLHRPMVMSKEQQEALNIHALSNVDIADPSPMMPLDQLPVQPFVVPQGCIERYKNPPQICRARFHGHGQIAAHGFTNPSTTPGHWVVFDDDTFGFIWLKLRSLSMYSRVKETLQAAPPSVGHIGDMWSNINIHAKPSSDDDNYWSAEDYNNEDADAVE